MNASIRQPTTTLPTIFILASFQLFNAAWAQTRDEIYQVYEDQQAFYAALEPNSIHVVDFDRYPESVCIES